MTIQRQLSAMQNRRTGICFRLLRRPGIQDDLRASLTSHIGPDPVPEDAHSQAALRQELEMHSSNHRR